MQDIFLKMTSCPMTPVTSGLDNGWMDVKVLRSIVKHITILNIKAADSDILQY